MRTARIGAIMAEVRERDAARARRRSPEKVLRDRDATRRDRGSCTVTLVRRADGELRTVAVADAPGAEPALRKAVAPFSPDEWAVQTVSTWRSIMADLQGRATSQAPPERALLRRAGLGAYLP